MRLRSWLGTSLLALVATSTLAAQIPARIELTSPVRSVAVGDSVRLSARVFDGGGNLLDIPVRFFSSSRREFPISRDGLLQPIQGGQFTVFAMVTTARDVRDSIAFTVDYPAIGSVEIAPRGERLFVGAAVRHGVTVQDVAGYLRDDVTVAWTTSDPAVASVDRFGEVTAHREGTVTVTAEAGGVRGSHQYRIVANPIRTLTLTLSQDSARMGDVVRVEATALDARGQRIPDAPITFSLVAYPEDTMIGTVPAGEIDQKGRFVAQAVGTYTILATTPGHVARRTIPIGPRHVAEEVRFIGQGAVRHVRTSDLWIWEGVDGRDYAVTGTWGGYGAAYFWDVTDPSSPVVTDSIVVDARTVNDVKISEDGAVAVISREGASNRRNGIVILDVRNPRDVRVQSTFEDGLTGGVHNVFVYDNHVYAVNNGRRFDVINIEDPTNPHRVGRFELDTPGHAIHDVWVVDGIAYTSNWGDGVVMIDVGNGVRGGSPSNPVEINRFKDVTGRTHAAFPYRSPTGRSYIFLGDETGRPGFDGQDDDKVPPLMGGYFHVLDVTDPEHPEEIARYEVPEAGAHNLWIEDDKLYAAYYNGGVRVVDISGELKGNLAMQGREVARYLANDPDGFIANAPFTWGPQPYKGNLFFAEHHSGLWAVRLLPREVLTP